MSIKQNIFNLLFVGILLIISDLSKQTPSYQKCSDERNCDITTRKCPSRSSNTIDIFCELNGTFQDCTKEVPEGTVSHMNCKLNYIDIYTPGPSISICKNGKWNLPLRQCIPECDEIVPEAQTLIVHGTSAIRGDYPWHVAVYRKKPRQPQKYICGGSIISVRIVVSAAHCFTDLSTGKPYPINQFLLAAGKHFSNWDAPEDIFHVQKTKILKIEIPDDTYSGSLSHYAGDIAVVVVKKAFVLTSFVRPVCVDWHSEHVNQQLIDGTLGKVAGWGTTSSDNPSVSEELKQLIVPYIELRRCKKIVPKTFYPYITLDKYCAGYTNGSSVCDGDSGSGMVFPYEDAEKMRYYFQGIVSVGPIKDGSCDHHQLGVYTKVDYYIEYIREIEESNRIDIPLDSSNKRRGCVAPTIKNGKFQVSGIGYTHDSLIKESSIIMIECNSGYKLSVNNLLKCTSGKWNIDIPQCLLVNVPSELPMNGECPSPVIENCKHEVVGDDQYILGDPIPNYALVNITCQNDNYVLDMTYTSVYCINGNFFNDLSKCTVTCPARISTSVDIDCELNNVKQNCSKEVLDGTVATMKCKSEEETYPGPTTATCIDGFWDVPLRECIPECGIPTKQIVAVDGVLTVRGDFPWHIAIYKQISQGYINYICGGSLISMKAVLSIGRCVFDSTNEHIIPASELSVVAGKYFSDWDSEEDAEFVQKRNISKIACKSNFIGNIAVLLVDKPFDLTNFVKPVCVDWNLDYVNDHLRSGSLGQVVGWDTLHASKVHLKQSTIPVIDYDQCQKTASKLIMTDKYCSGPINGTSLNFGDSGSGMIFPYEESRRKKYYIQGILDSALKEKPYDFNVLMILYTKVADNILFIKNIEGSIK